MKRLVAVALALAWAGACPGLISDEAEASVYKATEIPLVEGKAVSAAGVPPLGTPRPIYIRSPFNNRPPVRAQPGTMSSAKANRAGPAPGEAGPGWQLENVATVSADIAYDGSGRAPEEAVETQAPKTAGLRNWHKASTLKRAIQRLQR